MMSFFRHLPAQDMPRFQYYVKKHNLWFDGNPFKVGDLYYVRVKGRVEDMNAFEADMEQLRNDEQSIGKPEVLTFGDKAKFFACKVFANLRSFWYNL